MKTSLITILLVLTARVATAQLPADFPPIRTEVLGETAPGYVFFTVARAHDDVGFYIMMLENDGTSFFYKDLVTDYSYDFKVQPNGSLSYAQFLNHYTFTGGGDVEHIVLGPDYEVVDTWQMKNGYTAEAHEFQLLPNGHTLMISYHLEPMDLSHLGGHPRAMVAASIIQETGQRPQCRVRVAVCRPLRADRCSSGQLPSRRVRPRARQFRRPRPRRPPAGHLQQSVGAD
jgi:hypothetical protein